MAVKTARKRVVVWEVQGDFGLHGWETVDASEDRGEALASVRTYLREDPCHAYRVARVTEAVS